MMGIFQKSVIKNHLKTLDSGQVEKAYQKFRENYNSAKIEEIKNLKEEEYQSEFLREIFVDVLGYVLKPNENYNLALEFKNQGDSKKADGAILKVVPGGMLPAKAIAVIELKSTKTKDLKNATEQAFGYKHNQPDCKYVIISNFQKLQFYIDYANEYEEFDLFNLQRDEFELLYLLLNVESIFNDLPLKLKSETKFHEENISNKLYKDYSIFRDKLFENLIKNNPDQDKLTLFKKSQKLLDRFLFILFAEDSLLLPTNSITRIIDTYNKLEELDAYKPIYDIFRQYFGYMNDGRKGKTYADDIPAYNGGLFYNDELLDKLIIDDDVLINDLLKLSTYDFNTEVDVNILGHIFEHSLSEIEEIAAEIEGTATDKTKSKRKKDGIFYTPKYITQYIVENTVGTLCKEKRKEFEIVEIEFDGSYKIKEGTLSAKGKKLFETLEAYKKWLLTLKIVDPACGSGAFLNQALNFLIAEHKSIDDIIAELTNTPLRLFDTEKSILENNLYGVDINEESVEIAKLSLWLRTAHRDRKLSNLNSNIKCGNSLIDDPEVAGDKAFDWNKEFPEIMGNGGFDVVIGNPPYVHLEKIKDTSLALKNANYQTYHSQGDIYCVFVEKGIDVLKHNGLISYIMPNKWLQAGYGKPLREYFLKYKMIELIDFGDIQIFDGATTYPCIFISQKNEPQKEISISVLKESNSLDFIFNVKHTAEMFETSSFNGDTWVITSKKEQTFLAKLQNENIKLTEFIYDEAYYGIKTGLTEAFVIDETTKQNIVSKDDKAFDIIKPILRGRDIKPWIGTSDDCYIIGTFPSLNLEIENYPSIKEYLLTFGEERLAQSGNKGSRKKTSNKWFETQDTIAYYKEFQKPKIMYQIFQVKPCFIYDEQGLFCNNSMWIIPTDNKALVGVLNSKMGWWLITKYCTQIQNGCQLIWKYFGQIPIPKLNSPELTNLVEQMLEYTKSQQGISSKFIKYINSQFSFNKLSRKLENWHELEFSEFIKEINKGIKESGGNYLSKSDEMEWMDVFENNKTKAQKIKSEIEKTDKDINQIVYELYGLTEEEIGIVEGGV